MAGISFKPQIDFDMETQQGGSLCWIAIAVSVNRYFDTASTLRQCELVGKLPHAGTASATITHRSCCTPEAQGGGNVPPACDHTGRLDIALGAHGVDHLDHVLRGAMTFDHVQKEIEKGLPVCAFISFGGNDGHFILISGHNVVNGIRYLYVNDPLFRDGVHPYDRVKSNYMLADAEWKFTYKLKKGHHHAIK